MTFLEGSEYDVFISYGWAGAETVGEGDRRWVNLFQQKVALEMRARLGGRFAVFFDDYSQRNGFLYKNFLEKSGALLFIVSPGSCRADSWCRYELRRFLDQAQPVAHPRRSGVNAKSVYIAGFDKVSTNQSELWFARPADQKR